MTTYINPYKLFDLPIDSSEQRLLQNKERIMHQIKHYTPMDDVYIDGSRVLKNTVVELLKELDNYYTRQYHITIYEDKSLLNFLEFGHLNYFRNNGTSKLPSDSEFIRFITPYFSYQYSETLLQAIKTQDKEILNLLSKETLPMTGDLEEQCFRQANNYVAGTIRDLKVLQRNHELLYMSERELVSHLSNNTIELYNLLPDYFSSARNLIGNEIYSLSMVLLQNHGRTDGASAMLRQGLKLKLDQTVRQNLEQMLRNFRFQSKVPAFVWVAMAAISLLYMVKYLETVFGTQ